MLGCQLKINRHGVNGTQVFATSLTVFLANLFGRRLEKCHTAHLYLYCRLQLIYGHPAGPYDTCEVQNEK